MNQTGVQIMANSDPAVLRKAVSRLYDAFRESAETVGNVSSFDISIRQHQTMALVCRLTEDKPNGVTLKELAVLVGLTVDGVRYHIEKLRQEGILSREGATKGGRWIIRP